MRSAWRTTPPKRFSRPAETRRDPPRSAERVAHLAELLEVEDAQWHATARGDALSRQAAAEAMRTGSQPGLALQRPQPLPFSTEQKRMGLKGFPFIPNGTGGLEERLSVLWTRGVETGRLTPNEFVAATSTNIAKILNIYPQKGALVEGADADIVVWDPSLSKTVSATTQKSIIDYNVFEGFDEAREVGKGRFHFVMVSSMGCDDVI